MTPLSFRFELDGKMHTVEAIAPDEAEIAEMIRAVAARPTRFSLLKLMAQSPWDYLRGAVDALDDDEESRASKLGAGPGRDRGDALRFGTAVHHLVLGSADRVAVYTADERDRLTPPKPASKRKGRGVAALLDPQDQPDPAPASSTRVTRAGAAWTAFETEQTAQGRTILLASEMAQARAMADSILRSPRALQLLFDGTIVEQRIDWRLSGRSIRSTPDARRPGAWVADLKSCQDSSPQRFSPQIFRYLYHAQLECYCRAAEHADGARPGEAWIVAVDRKRPPRCYRLTSEALELGARCLGAWIETLKTCEASTSFPFDDLHVADLDDVELLDVPPEEEEGGDHEYQ